VFVDSEYQQEALLLQKASQ